MMMAPLLSPSSDPSVQQQQLPRISQVLPTVKCSSCNNLVPLAELGDHVCPKPPPLPRLKTTPTLPKPTLTPAAATALLPTRLQNLVTASPRSPSPASSTSSRSPNTVSPIRKDSPRISTNSSSSPPRNSPIPDSSRSATSPVSPLRVESARSRTPSNNFNAPPTTSSPLATRPSLDIPARRPSNNLPSRPSLDVRARTPSDQSNRPSLDTRARTPSNNAVPPSLSPGRGPNPVLPPPRQASYPSRPPPQQDPYNVPPAAEPAIVPEIIDTKSGGEAGMAGVGRRGFAAAARAAMFAVQNQGQYGAGSWNDGRGTPFRQNAPGYLNIQGTEYGNSQARSGAPLTPPSPNTVHSRSSTPQASTRTPSPGVNRGLTPTPVPIPNIPPSIPPLNTSFANTSSSLSPTSNSSNPSSAGPITPLGNARPPFFEKYRKGLPGSPASKDNEILYDSNNRYLSNSGVNSKESSTSPPITRARSASTSNGLPSSPAASRSASSASSYSARSAATRQRSNITSYKSSPSIPMSPSSGSEIGLAYADSTADDDDIFSNDEDKAPLRSQGSLKKDAPPPPMKGSILRSGSPHDERNHIRFPSISTDSSRPSTKSLGLKVPRRDGRMSTNSNSIYSDSDDDVNERAISDSPKSSRGLLLLDRVNSGKSDRSNLARGSELEMVMETLMEDLNGGSESEREMKRGEPSQKEKGGPARSNTVPGGSINLSEGRGDSSKLPPPPTTIVRSRTTPVSGNSAHDHDQKMEGGSTSTEKGTKAKKIRVCVKCSKQIDDGRWVAVDGRGGGVLCERCWKNMYLPKCRRCNLPIETAAISSSDGQLKGKYHKDCFNCHTCQKPFPDKTFYVFDGKPFCAYHYHEANDSLCAATRCGQPIEGPCAVSHTGDRYHPEHFLCEHPGYPPCKTRLEEYWEMDGRMLCDKHAHTARSTFDGDESEYGDEDSSRDPVQNGRAMKRVTRFIDLGDSGFSGLR